MHVDCAGPWTVHIQDSILNWEIKYQIQNLSIVDACTTWCELTLISTTNSKSCAFQFNKNMLYHYPRSSDFAVNNGNEYIGEASHGLLVGYDVYSRKHVRIKNHMAQA